MITRRLRALDLAKELGNSKAEAIQRGSLGNTYLHAGGDFSDSRSMDALHASYLCPFVVTAFV